MLSNEDIEKSLYYLNKYETIQIYRRWGISFILFGLINFLTAVILLSSLVSKNDFLLHSLWFLLPTVNIPVILGALFIILSFRYKFIGSLVKTMKKYSKLRNNPDYWKVVLITFFWMFFSVILNFYSYQLNFIPFPDSWFLASSFLVDGVVFLLIYIVQKKSYTEIGFKEFLYAAILMIIVLGPIFYLIQNFYFANIPNLYEMIKNLFKGSLPTTVEDTKLLIQFLVDEVLISGILEVIGLLQYFKLKKFVSVESHEG